MVTREPSVCYCPVVMGAQATVYLIYAWIRAIQVSRFGVTFCYVHRTGCHIRW